MLLKVWYPYRWWYAYHCLLVRGYFPEKRETILRDRLVSLAGPWHIEKKHCQPATSNSLRSTAIKDCVLRASLTVNSKFFIMHFREKYFKQNMKNTFWENVFVCKNFLSTVKKMGCRKNIRFLGGLWKMLRLCQF